MTDNRPQCLVCGRPMPTGDNSEACPQCWEVLRKDLAQMPALLADLDTTIARLDRVAASGRPSRPEEPFEPDPLPRVAWLRGETATGVHEGPDVFHVGASRARAQLHGRLASWVRVAAAEHPAFADVPIEGPALPGDPWPIGSRPGRSIPTTARGLAITLLALHGWLQGHPGGHAAITEIRDDVKEARHAVDRAPDLAYAGVCSAENEGVPCPEEIYIPVSKAEGTVACRTCRADHDIPKRRAYLLEAARDVLVTTTEACAAVSTYGEGNLPESTVRSWRQRGRLVPHGHDANGRELWLLGDVMDLATARDTTRSA